MSPQVRKLLDEALALSEDDRVVLSDGIWNSFGETTRDEMYSNHSMSDPEFRAEIELRLQEAEDHPERLVSWDEVKAAMYQRNGTVSKQ